ncbi:putative polysaccharide biosynthesis protein [Methanocella paludicola SANAE]|uniref:Polysaccharide biosynthesis protein n=1 Tax=Methanocella paludicola (strain DSM 17711 / JCM 13418 / NBRC 101707 / SANAE) TaxID=304371 RepID=D1YWZ0_METPS|nr:oligosaccharide flippase family protein [Methanocella paludicola]BAI60962.1 putative polysaccharide biosynthesis protein [Methanocella paludicola SANAE]
MSDIKKYYTEPIYRNSIGIILFQISGSLLGFIFWVITAHVISSREIGLATAAISAATLITNFSKFGIDVGLVRYLPQVKDKNVLYSTVLIVTTILALAFAVIFLLFLNIISPSLTFLLDFALLIMFVSYVILTSITTMQNTTLITYRKSNLVVLQNIILGVRIPLILLISSFGVLSIFFSLDVTFLIGLLINTLILYKYGTKFILRVDIITFKEIIGFSLGNYTAGIFSLIPTTIIPIMIINTLGAEQNAYFYIAYTFAGVLLMIPSSITMALFVEGSHNLPVKSNVFKSIKLISLILIPAVIFVFLFGDKLLLLFGKEYANNAFNLLKLLAISSLFSSVTLIYLSIKKIKKDIKILNIMNCISCIFTCLTGYIMLVNYGLIGLGYSWLITNFLLCVITIYIIIKYEHWINSSLIKTFKSRSVN